MPKPPLKILSVIPGSRYLAIVIFYDTELRDWRIQNIRGRGIKNRISKAKRILSNIIEQYHPNILALKKFSSFRSSKNLDILTSQIKDLGKKKGLRLYQRTWSEIKRFFTSKSSNKNEMAKIMTSQYPELLSDFQKE